MLVSCGWLAVRGSFAPCPAQKQHQLKQSSGDELGASARSYLRQVDAWTKVTRLPEEQRALVLHQHLQGRAWIEAEELDVETLASTQGMTIFKR